MATSIVLTVDVQGQEAAIKNINALDALANKLDGKKISFKIDASGIEEVVTLLSKLTSAQAKALTQMQKMQTAQAQEAASAARLAAEQEKTTQATERRRTAELNLESQQERTTRAQQKNTKETKNAAKASNLLGDSLVNIAKKMAVWQLMGQLVAAPIRALREGLETMKAVDSELAAIQKTTGFSASRISELTDAAYELATAYGRTADTVLQASTAFARAGYRDQIEQLSELSLLTQNVGDVEADTANEFLLAVDAAYQLNGSYDALMDAIDGLNNITNKNATDMDKMTSGITVAASVFATAGESIGTFAAMLGTATAATQRSGSEVARGLRTIMMNIRQIRGETEDGELIDGGSIANASKALKEYADIQTIVDGELRAASDILGELAGKWDSLGTVAQSALGEALAGKRQANILTSLMDNWDMYEKMLDEFSSGTGSALEENALYMESWEAKANQLTAAWTEFLSHLIDTKAIKIAIDALTSLIDFLDSGITNFAFTVGTVTLAVSLLEKGIKSLSTSAIGSFVKSLLGMQAGMAATATSTTALTGATMGLKAALQSVGPLFWVAAGTAAIYGIVKLVDAVTVSLEEQKETVENLNSEYETMFGTGSEYEELTNKAGALTDVEERRLAILEAQKSVLQDQISLETEKYYQKWQKQNGTGQFVGSGEFIDVMGTPVETIVSADVKALNDLRNAMDSVSQSFLDGSLSEDEYLKTAREIIAENSDLASALDDFQDLGFEVSDAQTAFLDLYEELVNATQINSDETDTLTEAYDQLTESLESGKNALEEYEQALEDATQGDAFISLAGAYEKFRDAMNRGLYGSADVRAFVDMMLPDDVLDGLGGDYRAAGEMLMSEFWEGVFSEGGEDYGANFVDALYEMADASGNLYDQNNQLAASFAVVDGGIETSIWSIDALASVLGTTPGAIGVVLDALGLYSATAADTTAQISENVEDIPEAHETTFTESGYENVVAACTAIQSALSNTPTSHNVDFTTSGSATVGRSSAEGTKNASGGPTLVNDGAGPELIAENGVAYIANGGAPALVNLSPGARVLTADETERALAPGTFTIISKSAAEGKGTSAGGSGIFSGFQGGSGTAIEKETSTAPIFSVTTPAGSGTAGAAGTSSGGGGSGKPAADMGKAQDEFDDWLANLLKQAELAENEDDLPRLTKIYSEILQGIDDLLTKYRNAGYAEDSNEILDLKNDLYDYAQKSDDVYDDAWERLIDAIKAQTDATENAAELEEKRQDLIKAQQTLENVKKQRTVRIYNSQTGQWEWIADEGDVADAMESVEDAQQDYEDERRDQLLEALESMREPVTSMADAMEVIAKLDPEMLADAALILGEELSAADLSDTESDAFKALYAALGALSGTPVYSPSTSSISTVGANTDSHDTTFLFPGGINITEGQAQTITLGQIANYLRVLGIT